MKRHLGLLLTVLLIASSLCGCGALDSLTGGKRAKTAQEVVENYANSERSNNSHVDISMKFNIAGSADGISVDIPMELSASLDVFDQNNMHGNMDMMASMFGEDMSTSSEVYMVGENGKTKAYSLSSEDTQWYVEEDGSSDNESFVSMSELDSKFFENATMEYDKSDKTYTVVQSFNDYLASGTSASVTDTSEDITSLFGMDNSDFSDMFKDAKVTYVFDSDYNLLSVTTSGAEYSGTIEEDGASVDIKFSIDLSVKYSGHGQIKAEDVAVPKEVEEQAVPSLSLDLDDFDFNMEDSSDDSFDYEDDSLGYEDDSLGYGDDSLGYGNDIDDYDSLSEDNNVASDGQGANSISQQASYIEMQKNSDMYGSYNGVNLKLDGNSWEDTFGADGWEFTSGDGEYIFLAAENSKYQDAEVQVLNDDWTDPTRADIANNGFFSYEVDFSWSNTNNYPNMTWNGLTFGATADDIISVYGTGYEPYRSTFGEYTTYCYSLDGDGRYTDITFTVYDDKGLTGVNVDTMKQ